jgi:hypothetical protein
MNVAEAFVVVAKGVNQSKGTVNKTSKLFNLFGTFTIIQRSAQHESIHETK